MKKTILWCLAAALLLAAAVPAVSLADGQYSFNSYAVDVDAMKAVEQKDTFGVVVIKKVVTDNVSSTSGSANRDVLTLTVENRSSATVSGVWIGAVAYTDERKSIALQREGSTGGIYIARSSGTAKRTISELSFPSLTIEPGKSAVVPVPCTHSFTGVRVMVAQYADADGEIFANELYPEWLELALGSPTVYLD